MAEKMTVEKAAEILGQGFHCSQCVMWHTAEALGMDKKQALKMTGGLGGGCFHGDVCVRSVDKTVNLAVLELRGQRHCNEN